MSAAAPAVVAADPKLVSELNAKCSSAVAIPNPDDLRIGDILKVWTKAVIWTGPNHFKPRAADAKSVVAAPVPALPVPYGGATGKDTTAATGINPLIVSHTTELVGAGGVIDHFPKGSVVVVGFPYDDGCQRNGGRIGAAHGPRQFRQLLRRTGPLSNAEFGIDLASKQTPVTIIDSGDVMPEGSAYPNSVEAPELEEMHRRLEERVSLILSAGAIPFVVGGSNDQSYPNASALLSRAAGSGSAVGVINIDAHLDVRPLKNGRVHSGSPFRCLLEDKRFADSKSKFVEFAAQSNQCSVAHSQYVTSDKKQHIVWLMSQLRAKTHTIVKSLMLPTAAASASAPAASAADTKAFPVAAMSPADGNAASAFDAVLDWFKRSDASIQTFVSFDIDSIRASDCPGVSAPGSVGLTSEEAFLMCFAAGRASHVRLFDMSEFTPTVEGYITGKLVAGMFYHFALGVALRHQQTTN